jgi:hypothetical protein
MKPIDADRKSLTENLLPTAAALLAAASLWIAASAWADTQPKYGPEALPLSSPEGHAYFRSHSAPDFWAMVPFYVSQVDESACSIASVQMLVNAARGDLRLTANDELATPQSLIKKVKNKAWHQSTLMGIPSGLAGRGVNLDQLGEIAQEALEAYGLKVAGIEVTHAEDQSAKTLEKLKQALRTIEKNDFVLINFDQGVFTGDTSAGHIAPLGAYDEENHRALVMDPDRKWYEPYWVSEKTLLAGMATRDPQSSKNRGWVAIKLLNPSTGR